MHHVTSTAATAGPAPCFGRADRQNAAGDAYNGVNELLWQAIHHQLDHVPSYAECLDVVNAMSDAELGLFL